MSDQSVLLIIFIIILIIIGGFLLYLLIFRQKDRNKCPQCGTKYISGQSKCLSCEFNFHDQKIEAENPIDGLFNTEDCELENPFGPIKNKTNNKSGKE